MSGFHLLFLIVSHKKTTLLGWSEDRRVSNRLSVIEGYIAEEDAPLTGAIKGTEASYRFGFVDLPKTTPTRTETAIMMLTTSLPDN